MKEVLKSTGLMILALVIFGFGMWLFLTMASCADAMDIYDVVQDEVYVDSRGAEAYGWELIEGIRLMMLECGSDKVPEADKREHCAVLFKQLYYTQTVGGYNGWGTTLWGIMHGGNTYLQTAPRIWTEDAEPTDEIIRIFFDVWENGYSSDFRVQCYRRDWFFQGEWAISAYQIGTTCYSINRWQDFSMFDIWEEPVKEEKKVVDEDWFRPEEKMKLAVKIYVR